MPEWQPRVATGLADFTVLQNGLIHGTGGGQPGTACCVTRDRPGAGCQAARRIGFYLLLF